MKGPLGRLIQETQANEKTRREKKMSYLDKLGQLARALENIEKRKSIGVKANTFIAELPQ